MLKGLVLTPPEIGRISIGQVVERNGKRLPQKDDQFTLTSQIQTSDGWIRHPLDEKLRNGQKKLREIPVQLLFNEPDLNLRTQYCLFDRQTARPICVGNGESCQRHTPAGYESFACPSPEHCDLSQGYCKPFGRMNVVVKPDDDGADDPIGSFIFRTSGFNSIRTLAARLNYFKAISGDRLSCLPLALKIRGKSTRQSFGHPIYYVDLTLRTGMRLEDTLTQAKTTELKRLEMGFDQSALDEAALTGLRNGHFEEDEETVSAVIEEFFPDPSSTATTNHPQSNQPTQSLTEKLAQQTQQPQQT